MNTITTIKAEPVFVKRDEVLGAVNSKDYALYRMDGYGERFYYTLNESGKDVTVAWFPSITSIQKSVYPLSSAIIAKMMQMGSEEWYKYLNNKAAFGTFWHMLAAEYLTNGHINLSNLQERIEAYQMSDPNATDTSWWFEQAWKGMLSWIEFCKSKQLEALLIETPLRSAVHGYAGTVDLLCRWVEKGETVYAVIDWKTGDIWDEYACQLRLQQIALIENYPALADKKMVLLNWTWTDWRKAPGFQVVNQTESPFAKTAEHALAVHKLTKPQKPKGMRMPVFAEDWSSQGETSEMWQYVEIDEVVLQKHYPAKQ